MRKTAVASWVLGLVLAGWPVAAADDLGCEPSPEWEKSALSLARETSSCSKQADCLTKMHARWLELLAKMPRDMRAHFNYGRSFAGTEAAGLAEAYLKKKMEAAPRDPFHATAYGHVLKSDSDDQIAAYEAALKLDPGYGWAHYYLAARFSGRHGSREIRDADRAKPHVRGWLAACPADGAGLQMAGRVGDKEMAVEIAAAARKILAEEKGDYAVRRHEGLWALEFKAAPASEHDALRDRVRADIARLKAAGDSAAVLQTVHAAYTVIGDREARDATEKEMVQRFPCESATLRSRMTAWDKDHPRPEFHAEDKARHEYDQARYALESELARTCPAHPMVAEARVRTARSLTDLSASEVEAMIDDLLAARAKGGSPSSPALMADPAVELAVNYRVRLDRIPELLQGWSDTFPMPEPPADAPESRKRSYESMRRRSRFERVWLKARADHLLGKPAPRDAGIADLEKILDEADMDRQSLEARLAWLRAEIAESDGKSADALVFYQQAAAGLRSDEFFLRASRAALKRLGASEAALATLVAPRRVRPPVFSSVTPWKDIERELPTTSLDLVGGGRWAVFDDLKGKRTFVNVWATWCGPCKKELPELQKLHERIKGRADVAVVALNIDDNPGVVQPFLKENGYTFPVALAAEYWDSLKLESRGIPQNWVVDEKGMARAELRGFGLTSGDAWVSAALARLEGKKEAAAEGRAVLP